MGGLSCVINYVFRGSGLRTECIAIKDRFGQSAASYDDLMEEYGLTSRHIWAAVETVSKRVGLPDALGRARPPAVAEGAGGQTCLREAAGVSSETLVKEEASAKVTGPAESG
jgi:hypothetical protein